MKQWLSFRVPPADFDEVKEVGSKLVMLWPQRLYGHVIAAVAGVVDFVEDLEADDTPTVALDTRNWTAT